MKFLDTNIFLRYLVEPQTPADELRHQACIRLFQEAAAGKISITTSESVLHEVFYVLCSPRQYKLTHAEAIARMQPLLSLKNFRLPKKRLFARAIDVFAQNSFLDFADAMSTVYCQTLGYELISYDGDFDKIPHIKRTEP